MRHAKTISRPKWPILVAAVLAVAFIATFFGVFNARADENAAPATQQVIGRTVECKLNTTSACVIEHGLGVKPTAVVVTPGGPGQNATVDITKINDKTFTVKFLWHDGKGWPAGTVIRFSVIYTFVGGTTPPTTTPTPTPTVTPVGYACNPSGEIAHFYPSGNDQGSGSDAIGDAPSTEIWGQYNISAEQWAVKNDYLSNLCAYSKDNWYVDIKATNHGDGAVQSYPSIRKIYHDWGSDTFANDPKLSSFAQLKATVAHTSPANCTGCIYEEAFDIWLNGIGGDSPELMIWTHNQGQEPYGDLKASNFTLDGVVWDYYNSGTYMAFVPHDKTANLSGKTFDLKQYIGYVKAVVGTDPKVGQVSYGVEPVNTNGVFKRWTFSKFVIQDK